MDVTAFDPQAVMRCMTRSFSSSEENPDMLISGARSCELDDPKVDRLTVDVPQTAAECLTTHLETADHRPRKWLVINGRLQESCGIGCSAAIKPFVRH